MQFSQVTFGLIALFSSLAVAAPAPAADAEVAVERSPNAEGLLGQATVRVYRSDTCTNLVEEVTIFQGGQRCIPYTNVRSIDVNQSGCTIKTWSGNNCRGSQYTARNGCNSVLYASISINC
ncbi:hypothetical protein HJFPF1_07277 [Paramyrothecium foliicola]|nr:hypothetical protein HJFPF1_07277 [Paramyrothecium foliicola]